MNMSPHVATLLPPWLWKSHHVALGASPGAVLSRAQLEDRLYGWGEEIESNAVSVYVHQLRKKLGADFIRNVRGVGYFIDAAAPGAGR